MKKRKTLLLFLILFAALLFMRSDYSYAQTPAETKDDPGYWKAHGYYQEDNEESYEGEYAITKFGIRNEDSEVKIGVDVSKYQGQINWETAKAAGVEFAIIRVGYRGYGAGTLAEDPYYVQNIEGALKAGIPVGVYMFSQAITEKEAIEEANFLLERICDYKITLPVVMDYEYTGSNGTDGRLYQANLSAEEATDICKAFLKTVKKAGYTPMLYANKYMLTSKLNAEEIEEDYRIWLAHYTSQTDYEGIYDFWQFTSTGDGYYFGMQSQYLDLNYWYDDGSIRGRVYRIKYELNGGKNSSKNPLTYRNSEVVLKEPKRTGYVFRGWYTDENFENQITTIEKGTKKDIKVYAKWEVEVKPTKVKLNKTSVELKKGKTRTLKATVSPDNVTTEGVTWTSSNEKVATVDSSGKVTAVGHGAATITATANGDSSIKAECKIVVPYTIKYVLNDGTNSSENPSTYYNEKVVLQNPTKEGYVFKGWYTDKDFKNKITKIEKGTKKNYTLYAKWKKEVKPTKIELNITSTEIKKGKTLDLEATISPSNITTKGAIWTSSNEKVATVDSSGKVTAVGYGTATITATAKGDKNIKVSCKVTVPYTIKYKLDGGTNNSKNPATYYNEKVSLKNPTREGYIFKGWYTDKDYKNKIKTIEKGTKKNYTLYAKWEKIIESIEVAEVSLSKSSYTYDGKAKKPTVTIVLNGKTLEKDIDYTVAYKNNKKIGKATVTITGINDYEGVITKTFTISAQKGKIFSVDGYKYKVTSSSAVAFVGIKDTETTVVTIPKTVKYGGKNFKVTAVGKNALKGNTKVKKVIIRANVKTINPSAFEGCKKLSKVTFGSAVTKIEDKAFKNCTALKSITIPSKVTKIDKQAFYGCKKLKTITIKSTKLETVGKEAFKKTNSNATIKVPKSKLSSYKKMLKNKGLGSNVKFVKYN